MKSLADISALIKNRTESREYNGQYGFQSIYKFITLWLLRERERERDPIELQPYTVVVPNP